MYPETEREKKEKEEEIFQHRGILTHTLTGIMTSIFSVCHQESTGALKERRLAS